ncbi:preprotein translocase subunit YajC [Candidatus Sulfidibacterium hydrothermale]|uniref:preprotein translocase subunit YajC n=1 Tax=Candidatus Sulfidibacterium hydrothermale TaxID=2875962 RepID=UPI001F0AB3D7|nr:preprotein translocase subunit YajC [Candidatus Sulfidibacterium hydrothermale]UBM61680.1 preprotein translocase subunit YajC [Candidatus Sulfidibacterium hydrothermale]
MNTLFVLLAAPQGQSSLMSLLPLLLILVVFYFFFIMPQSKKNKALKKFREGLKKGDKIVTIGGIHGKIVEVKERTVVIEVGTQGTKMTIEKSAVAMDNEIMGQK